MRSLSTGLMLCGVVIALGAGCSEGTNAPSTTGSMERPKADYAKLEEEHRKEIEKAMAQLSPEDRVKAEAQKVCLVAEGELGGMGKPYKMTVQGRDIFLCCEHCKEKVENDPEKYLAKLNKILGTAPAETK